MKEHAIECYLQDEELVYVDGSASKRSCLIQSLGSNTLKTLRAPRSNLNAQYDVGGFPHSSGRRQPRTLTICKTLCRLTTEHEKL
jgi:hypothetical protein